MCIYVYVRASERGVNVLRCAVLMRMLLFNILFSKYSRFNLKFLAIPHEPLSAFTVMIDFCVRRTMF